MTPLFVIHAYWPKFGYVLHQHYNTFAFKGIELWMSTTPAETGAVFGTPVPLW